MKKLLYYSLIFFISFQSNAQVKFESSLTEAFKLAKEQNKIVFIDYYNSECTVCKNLSDLFEFDTKVADYYNKYFINYKLDTKGDSNGNLKEDEKNLIENSKLTFDYVPVLLFFDLNGNFLHHSGVKVESDVVLNIGISARNPEYRSSSNLKKYNNGDRSIRTLYALSSYLVVTSNESLLEVVSKNLYDVYSKDSSKMSSMASFTILKNVIKSTENGFFVYWINQLESLKDSEQGYQKEEVRLALEKILLNELSNPNRIYWVKEKKDLFKDYVLQLNITDNPDSYFD